MFRRAAALRFVLVVGLAATSSFAEDVRTARAASSVLAGVDNLPIVVRDLPDESNRTASRSSPRQSDWSRTRSGASSRRGGSVAA